MLYQAAHGLGPEALPYLFELPGGDLANKPFWVNIILTIGFIEHPMDVHTANGKET